MHHANDASKWGSSASLAMESRGHSRASAALATRQGAHTWVCQRVRPPLLPVESVIGPAGLQEHLFLINCIPFFGNLPPACPMLFSLQKQGFLLQESHCNIALFKYSSIYLYCSLCSNVDSTLVTSSLSLRLSINCLAPRIPRFFHSLHSSIPPGNL